MSAYAHPDVLVGTQWLADHLNDPNLRIVEIDVNPTNYDSGHIPGAVFWNGLATIITPDYFTNLDKKACEALFSGLGISNNTSIILYSAVPSLPPWGFWFLKLFGHQDVRILNGGRKKWLAEGRGMSQSTPSVLPAQYHAGDPDRQLWLDLEGVKSAIGRQEYAILDVRTQKEYDGETFIYNPPQGTERAGHIPGAIHLSYESAMNEDGTFKPTAELEGLYLSNGITREKTIVPYCAFGGRASNAWFVLKYLLGYPDVQPYPAGWVEWSKQTDGIVAHQSSAL
jgi:thiosulfate/3-mercaptopyruvate sulfurtransferase